MNWKILRDTVVLDDRPTWFLRKGRSHLEGLWAMNLEMLR